MVRHPLALLLGEMAKWAFVVGDIGFGCAVGNYPLGLFGFLATGWAEDRVGNVGEAVRIGHVCAPTLF